MLQGLQSRTKQLFDESIYGIIGGLHYPGLGGKEIKNSIELLKKENPKLVSISTHDSYTKNIKQFELALGKDYQQLKVGKEIIF